MMELLRANKLPAHTLPMQPKTLASSSPPPQAGCLIKARDLEMHFGGKRVLERINFDLHAGEVVLLTGENGTGKTTLLNVVSGNLSPNQGVLTLQSGGNSHSFTFPIRSWYSKSVFERTFSPETISALGICRTWQDIRLFETLSLRENLLVAARHQIGENPLAALLQRKSVALCETRVEQEVDDLLAAVGLQAQANASADMVSFGQAKRASIARSIMAGANVLLLDEPLSGLDSKAAHEVVEMLRRLSAERGVTLVIVEHALNHALLDEMVTVEWRLESGTLDVVRRSSGQLARQKIAATKRPSSRILDMIGGNVVDQPLPHGASLKIASRCIGDRVAGL
jgi:branched-chain amino acid transport system ATP-binding protein